MYSRDHEMNIMHETWSRGFKLINKMSLISPYVWSIHYLQFTIHYSVRKLNYKLCIIHYSQFAIHFLDRIVNC